MTNFPHFAFRLSQWLVLGFILGAFLDRAIPEGMFFDGVTYASISRNLAEGKGSLWNLHFRGDGAFVEHPPLHMGIQALFFKVLGDKPYTESIFCLFILLFSLWAIVRLWQTIPEPALRQGWALPLWCWSIIPTVIWSYPNNLLDATMALFDMASVLFIIKAMSTSRRGSGVWYTLLAGISLFAATLTKGPVGLFPLATPILYALLLHWEKRRKATLVSLGMTLILLVAYGGLCIWPEARTRLGEYMEVQVLMALGGKREKVDSFFGRWDLIRELLVQLSPALVCGLILVLWGRWKTWKLRPFPVVRAYGWFFLWIGLSASLPMLASIKQRSFYLLPAFPFFGLAIGAFVFPYVHYGFSRISLSVKARRGITFLCLIAAIGLAAYLSSQMGDIGRDESLITEILEIPDWVPVDQKIGICQSMESDYSFLSYAQRYIGLETRSDYHRAEYILLDKSRCQGSFASCLSKLGFREVPTTLPSYRLYQRQSLTLPPGSAARQEVDRDSLQGSENSALPLRR